MKPCLYNYDLQNERTWLTFLSLPWDIYSSTGLLPINHHNGCRGGISLISYRSNKSNAIVAHQLDELLCCFSHPIIERCCDCDDLWWHLACSLVCITVFLFLRMPYNLIESIRHIFYAILFYATFIPVKQG